MDKPKRELIILIVGAVFLICGSISVYDAVYCMKKNARIKSEYVETTATITSFEQRTHKDSKGTHTSYQPIIKYTVNGEEYEDYLGYYTAGMIKGDKVTVYCDPADPSKHKSPSMVDVIGFLIFGIAFSAVGGGALGYEVHRFAKVDSVFKNGKYILCDEWEEVESNVRVNRVRYNCIKCTYTKENGRKLYFTSLPFHPNNSPAARLTDKVKVYVDIEKDPMTYFVSAERIE